MLEPSEMAFLPSMSVKALVSLQAAVVGTVIVSDDKYRVTPKNKTKGGLQCSYLKPTGL